MTYPEEIVSRSAYKEKILIEALNVDNFCVTRRIDGKVSEHVDILNGYPVLDPDCLGNIVEMSVNLLGGAFLPDHTLWVQVGEGKRPWDGKKDVRVEDYPGCYRLHDGEYVFYKANLLHHAVYPNGYLLKNKEQYKAYHNALNKEIDTAFKENVITNISVTLMLDPDPSNLNYWHLKTLTLLTEKMVELKNDSSYRKLIFSHILCHVLCKHFLQKDATSGKIRPDIYMK